MSGERVLVVDDEPAIRRLLRGALERAGYEVTEAADARSALAAFDPSPPDAVLLDLGLPCRDGFAVLADLKAEMPDVPVLIVTAWDDTASVTRSLEGGAHDYIRKPFARAELTARVEAALRVKATMDALAGVQVQLLAPTGVALAPPGSRVASAAMA